MQKVTTAFAFVALVLIVVASLHGCEKPPSGGLGGSTPFPSLNRLQQSSLRCSSTSFGRGFRDLCWNCGSERSVALLRSTGMGQGTQEGTQRTVLRGHQAADT